jgi:hypothetical protein
MSEANQLTVQKIYDAHIALSKLIETDKVNKFFFSRTVRMRISSYIRKTRPIFEDYTKERDDLIRALGELTNEKTQTYKVKPENQDQFNSEIKAMLEATYEIEFKPLTQDELFGVTEQQEAGGSKPNQIEMDLINLLEDVGLLKV